MDGGRWDVVIAGGGPAGCAAALGLRARTAALSVLLIEASSYGESRVGELLPAAAGSLLRQLDLQGVFEAEGFLPAFASAASWGTPRLVENHFLFSARGHGWHLDRARFDSMLARELERRGGQVRRGTTLVGSERDGDAWRLTLSGGDRVSARFVVDATGRKGVFARSVGASFHVEDRLTGFVRFVPSAPGSDPRTLIEAFSDGWWYTAPLPGGTRVVACMTDVDIGRDLGLPDVRSWSRLLGSTIWIKQTVSSDDAQGPCLVRAADSKVLTPMGEKGWLAAGDSAMAFDPLSSQGITKALRAGILASYAVGDCLTGDGGFTWLARYEGLHRRELAGYLRAYASHFADEQRFADREFWKRRHCKGEPGPGLAGRAFGGA